jgi:predicted MPP superfamily phosphohydrolase
MFWIHITADLLMITLDMAWWVIAMRLAQKPLWRVLISAFMVVQLGIISLELLSRLGWNNFDFSLVIPRPVLAVTVIWHYLALAALLALGSVYAVIKMVRRLKTKDAVQKSPEPARSPAPPATRREFIGTCAALAPSIFTFSLAGVALEQLNHFRVRRFDVSIPTLPKPLDGLTIAHVTDSHVGEWTHGQILHDMVDATNALDVDIVAFTGDLINYELRELPAAIALLKGMQSRYGLWMVEGNHDMMEDGVEFERRVKASGLKLLLDESEVATIRGCPVQFLGLRWMDGIGAHRDQITAMQMRELMKQRQPDAFPIFLAHHPHSFDAAVKAGLPLTLTGHTHGGQLMLDKQFGVGPMLFRYWSGQYQRANSQLIVSNGVGNMFPLRINAPAEILHITLHSTQPSAAA